MKMRLADAAGGDTPISPFQQVNVFSDAPTEESNTPPEQIAIHRARKMDEGLYEDLQLILDDIHELKEMKKKLLDALGAKDTSQIPGLLPQYVKPLRGIENFLGDGHQPK